MKWVYKLLGLHFCQHNYKIIETQKITGDVSGYVMHIYTLQCSLCGKMNHYKVKP